MNAIQYIHDLLALVYVQCVPNEAKILALGGERTVKCAPGRNPQARMADIAKPKKKILKR